MNWLLWGANRLWSYYFQHEEKARAMRGLRHIVSGMGLTVLSFLFGFCALGLFLLSSFCYFLDQTKFSFAALWTALIASALTLAVWLVGNRVFQRSLKV